MAFSTPSVILSLAPQRKCEAWSFAMSAATRTATGTPFLNESAKRGASQCKPARVETPAWDTSSTKVRSVELRNMTAMTNLDKIPGPQRKCEAWSFAIRTGGYRHARRRLLNESAKRGASQCFSHSGEGWNGDPQRKCEAWSFAILTAVNSVSMLSAPQRKCEAWSFAICSVRFSPWPRCAILNESAKRGASQYTSNRPSGL